MITLIVKLLTSRSLWFALLCLISTSWILGGKDVVRRAVGSETVETQNERMLADVEARNPQSASFIRDMLHERGHKSTRIAFRSSELMNGGRASAARDITRQYEILGDTYYSALAELAERQDLLETPEEREEFLYSYGAFFQTLGLHEGSADVLRSFLIQLQNSAEDRELWRLVKRDPLVLILSPDLRNEPALLTYFSQESDWLGELLLEVAAISRSDVSGLGNGARADTTVTGDLIEALRTAKTFHPLLKQTVEEEQLGLVGYLLFLEFGPIIADAVQNKGLPLTETLEVVFMNADVFGDFSNKYQMEGYSAAVQLAASGHADDLRLIHRARPDVWYFARHVPLTLRFDQIVGPAVSAAIFENYAGDDIPALLFTTFTFPTGNGLEPDERAIREAARAIYLLGDMAIFVIANLAEPDELVQEGAIPPHVLQFADFLGDEDIGARIIPFVLLHQRREEAFAKARSDPRWVDRFVDENGRPRPDKSAWLAVPIVGGPATIISNWANDYPNTWGEIGWAALDIADAGLLVATLGTSAAATGARRAAISSVRTSGQRTALRSSGGARAARQTGFAQRTFLAPALRQPVVRETVRVGRYLVAPVVWTTNSVRVPLRNLKEVWVQNQRLRLWTYRGALAAGLSVTVAYRTVPMAGEALERFGSAVGEFAGQLTAGTAKMAGAAISSAAREIIGRETGGWTVMFIYGLILVTFIGITVKAFPRRSAKQLTYA